MADFSSLYGKDGDISDADAVKAGKAAHGAMKDEHTDFVKLVCAMITEKKINVSDPETFLHKEIFDALSDTAKNKVQLAMVNIADLLRHIADFYMSKETPDSSPQLANMIDQLFVMKDRIEKEHGDVFVF